MSEADIRILVINSGSSSVKYKLIGQPSGEVVATGSVERIGEDLSFAHQECGHGSIRHEAVVSDHHEALDAISRMLVDPKAGPLEDFAEIDAFGHRVVHGGERFHGSVLIDDSVIAGIEDCAALAPLHNPANLEGVRAAQRFAPGKPQAAVFDTAFHQTIPPKAFRYALPEKLYRESGIRRYGFHGTSYQYVSRRASEFSGLPVEGSRWIICHLGNGCSIAAVENGRSVDTSMGMTPLEGLVMGSRSGDVDPAVLVHLARHGMDSDGIDRLLNRESGLLGLSGSSNDMRELTELRASGDEKASLAIDVFCHRVRKYIGAYLAVMGGCDGVVFTGGIGEHAINIREEILEGMAFLGLEFDPVSNAEVRGREGVISTGASKIRALVIPTDEEGEIARQTYRLVHG